MRKGITEVNRATIPLSPKALKHIEEEGYQYVQVKGLTADKHYDYIEPHFLVLVPIRELPDRQDMKDIYEPIPSELLRQWALQTDEGLEIVIAPH